MTEWLLTHDVYDPPSFAQAIADYRPHLMVSVLREGARDTVIAFAGPHGQEPPDEVVREFLNYALDLSVRTILGAA